MERKRTGGSRNSPQRTKPKKSTGLKLLDALEHEEHVALDDYIRAASEYVRTQRTLSGGGKSAQIRLSSVLAKALLISLRTELPSLTEYAKFGEIKVSGGLRGAQIDVVEFHPLD